MGTRFIHSALREMGYGRKYAGISGIHKLSGYRVAILDNDNRVESSHVHVLFNSPAPSCINEIASKLAYFCLLSHKRLAK